VASFGRFWHRLDAWAGTSTAIGIADVVRRAVTSYDEYALAAFKAEALDYVQQFWQVHRPTIVNLGHLGGHGARRARRNSCR